MNAVDFVALAQANSWNRKRTRNELYKVNDETLWAKRDEILVALGFAPTAEAQPVAEPAPAPKVEIAPPAPRIGKGQFALKFPATDALTGEPLAAGTIVTGVKLGGEWDFTAEPISLADFKHLREAMLLSLGDDEGGPDGGLDHEDYYILEEFGNKYKHVAAMIGCHVPGLD